MKLVHLSDVHIDDAPILGHDPVERFEAVLAHVAEHHGDAERIVVTGDLTHRGDGASYRRLRVMLQNAGLIDEAGTSERLRLLIGNHDDRAEFLEAFPQTPRDAHGFVQYVDDTPAGRLVCLDTALAGTHAGHLSPERLAWLAEALGRARDDAVPTYLFMHHNPVPVGVASSDTIGLVQWRELGELLSGFPGTVRHLFFGHCHFTLAGSVAGIPFSAPRSTCHPCWPDPGSDDPRLGVGPLEPSYAVALLEPSHTVVHSIDFLREPDVRRLELGSDGWVSSDDERGSVADARSSLEPA